MKIALVTVLVFLAVLSAIKNSSQTYQLYDGTVTVGKLGAVYESDHGDHGILALPKEAKVSWTAPANLDETSTLVINQSSFRSVQEVRQIFEMR